MLENQRYLTGREHVLLRPVVRLAESFGELLVGSNPIGQTVEGSTGADVGGVGFCQFAFVIRADAVFHLSDDF